MMKMLMKGIRALASKAIGKVFAAVCLVAVLNACQDQTITPAEQQTLGTYENEMTEIAGILARTLQDPAVGKFIKSKALMKFDEDYDVLIHMVLDQEVEQGRPLIDYLQEHAEGRDIRSLLGNFPLLSLYVPDLTDFSAEKWNIGADDIAVGIAYFPNQKNEIRIVRPDGSEDWQSVTKAPDYPVVVLKENERVGLVSSPISNDARVKADFNYNGFSYYFLNPDAREQARAQAAANAARMQAFFNFDLKVKEAYSKSQGCATCYHRDYIYYNISPSEGITQGPFDSNYTEAITYFQFENVATAQTVTGNWTEGSLEFHINVLFIGASSALTALEKVYNVDASALYNASTGELRAHILPSPLEIVPWQMDVYGDKWKFNVYEFDPGTTTAVTTSHSTTKSENFTYNTEIAAIIKIGSGYGSSETTVVSNSTTITTTTTSNQLGEAVHNWFDPVIAVKGGPAPVYLLTYSKEISTGSFRFSCETIRKPLP